MINDAEIKDSDRLSDWKKRTDDELTEINEKSAINFYSVAGLIIAIFGVFFFFNSTYYVLALAIPLGFLVMGVGSILNALRKK